MSAFDTFVVVDWSARSAPSPARPSKDAIWIGVARERAVDCHYHRTRHAAMQALEALMSEELAAGRRVLAGFDFPFGYPRGFARAVTGRDDPLVLWAALAERIEDDTGNANNRFDVAKGFNRLFPGTGPFWGCPSAEADADLPERGTLRDFDGLPERREVEHLVRRAQPCWKLYTTGSVGSQALLGLPHLHRLRGRFGADMAVAPFEALEAPLVLAEVFPSLIADVVADLAEPEEIPDRTQVRVLAAALSRLAPEQLAAMLRAGDPEEGWILGAGDEAALRAAARPELRPPPLRNDCFALPPGIAWTPVDEALAMLRARLHGVVPIEEVPLAAAEGRILARDVTARRSNPPEANTAVDGYGFAGGAGAGVHEMPLVAGRSAAGAPFEDAVPPGSAIRVLTGAALPEGVDTVVLDEDVTLGAGRIAFRGPLKAGANTRAAGEDARAGAAVLAKGRGVTPADLALMAAVGVADVPVFRRLRVGVMSTGDELVEAGETAGAGQIFDANRPMLAAMIRRFGFEAVDLGRIPDNRAAIAAQLDKGAGWVDVILTSGGASAGDEDHISALLNETGSMAEWRIAVKPGRPLALGLWNGVPVFGLPGNPVAAMVCTLIFARPALEVLAGGNWSEPQGIEVPAAFAKRKKPGRREYLRARLRDGRAEVFASEGSGRISGLSWAEGLVELGDDAREIRPGDMVRYVPYGSFGL